VIKNIVVAVFILFILSSSFNVNAEGVLSVAALGFRINTGDKEDQAEETSAQGSEDGISVKSDEPVKNEPDKNQKVDEVSSEEKKSSGALGFNILKRARKVAADEAAAQKEALEGSKPNELGRAESNSQKSAVSLPESATEDDSQVEVSSQSSRAGEEQSADSFDASSLRNDITRFTPITPKNAVEEREFDELEEPVVVQESLPASQVPVVDEKTSLESKDNDIAASSVIEESDIATFQSVRDSILAGRVTKPQFVSKVFQLGVSSEKNLSPYVSYSMYWLDVYSALEFDTFQRESDAVITGLPPSVAQNNQIASKIDKDHKAFKLYPLNWVSRFRRFNFSYGLLYQYQKINRTEQVEESVKIDSELGLELTQFGMQASMLYHKRAMDMRARLSLPLVNQLSIEESYIYQDSNGLNEYQYNGGSDSNFAFDVSVDLLYRTRKDVNFLLNLSYRYLPLNYTKAFVSLNIDEQVEFESVESDEAMTTAIVSASVLFESLQLFELSPYLQLSARRDSIENKELNIESNENALLFQLGLSSEF